MKQDTDCDEVFISLGDHILGITGSLMKSSGNIFILKDPVLLLSLSSGYRRLHTAQWI